MRLQVVDGARLNSVLTDRYWKRRYDRLFALRSGPFKKSPGSASSPSLRETGLIDTMAAGDAQRVWFEEMVDTLRSKWQRELPFEDLIRLRDELDEMLQRIRSERQLRPPVLKCPKCGQISEGAAPK